MSLRLTAILTALWISLLAQAERADHPNVIVIMADDIGAEGLACYGSTIYTTPNLDRMAAEGLRFENAYATPLCTPTRVMIMSGLYPPRTGFRALIGKGEASGCPQASEPSGMISAPLATPPPSPESGNSANSTNFQTNRVEHGFDEYCMWTWVYGDQKSSRYYKPQIYHNSKVINGGERDFGPDYFHDFALDFIDRKKNEPFFLYYPMALVHSPFVHPPKLEKLARTNFRDDLDKQTIAFGHMITYMDHVVGSLLNRLKKHDLDKNTLVLFTGDNGTHKNITSHLPGLKLKGGKGTMTEAGSRVPLLAWWPDTIRPGVRDEFFCLVDVLPTVTSPAGIRLNRKVDGLNLAHHLTGGPGKNREHVLINYGRGYFVRDKRFRLNQDGKLYDIPVTSNATRYSEQVTTNLKHQGHRRRLQTLLDNFMAIENEYTTDKVQPLNNKK